MTNDEIKRMMAQVDEKYIAELTEDTAEHPGEPAEIVSGETPIVKSSPWRAVAAIAAAVLLIVPGVYLARQASMHMTPSESISDGQSPEAWEYEAFDGTLDAIPQFPEYPSVCLAETLEHPLAFGQFLGNFDVSVHGDSETMQPYYADLLYRDPENAERCLTLVILDHTDDLLADVPGKALTAPGGDVIFHGKMDENGEFACAFHQGTTQYTLTGKGLTKHELAVLAQEILNVHPTAFLLGQGIQQRCEWLMASDAEGEELIGTDVRYGDFDTLDLISRRNTTFEIEEAGKMQQYTAMKMTYTDGYDPWRRVNLCYTTMPAATMPAWSAPVIPVGSLNADTLLQAPYRNANGDVALIVDYGMYRMNVAAEGLTDAELSQLADALLSIPEDLELSGREIFRMEAQDFATLADADNAGFPWHGKVIRQEVIGEKAVDSISTSGDDLNILYAAADPESVYIRLHYEQWSETLTDSEGIAHMTPENGLLDADAVYNDAAVLTSEDTLSFFVDYPDYRLFVSMERNEDEFRTLIDALNEVNRVTAASAQPSVTPVSADSRPITYEEALELGGSIVPARTMGSMTLDEDSIQKWSATMQDADGSTIYSDFVTFVYSSGEQQLTFTIADGNYTLWKEYPEISGWSMKLVTQEPIAHTIGDNLMQYSFCVRYAGYENHIEAEDGAVGERQLPIIVAVDGQATTGQIDPFVQHFDQIWWELDAQKNGTETYQQPSEFQLDAVNAQDTVWNGRVTMLEKLGRYNFCHADLHEWTTANTNRRVKRENLYYDYTPDATENLSAQSLGLTISYTDMTPEELYFADKVIDLNTPNPTTICTDDRFLYGAQNEFRVFVADMGEYRVCVTVGADVSQEDMRAIILELQYTLIDNETAGKELAADELNRQDTVWNGKVVEQSDIGSYRFDSAFLLREKSPNTQRDLTTESVYYILKESFRQNSSVIDAVNIDYTNALPSERDMSGYLITPEELNAATVCTEARFRCGEDNSAIAFALDMGDYRICLNANASISQEDMQAFIDAILAALQ